MFDKFGEFDSWEEINKAAEGQKEEGDIEALKELAKENGIDIEDVTDYQNSIINELCTPLTAAMGKIDIEVADLNPKKDIMIDWIDYIRTQIADDEDIRTAVRKKGKSLKGCIGMILKWGKNNMHDIDSEIKSAAGFSGNVKLGMPASLTVKKIIKDYYLGR